MKKQSPTLTVQDQILPPPQSQSHGSNSKATVLVTRQGPTLLGRHQSISYIPGEKPLKEPPELPRLFIQGFGGSVKMDLRGVGVRFSQGVFAHMVADDCLRSIQVCRGDIAIVEPAFRRLHEGNLVLVSIDGRPVLRRLWKKDFCWMLNPVDRSSSEPVVLSNYGIQGVVLGFLRLLTEMKPVRYEGTDAIYDPGFEIPPAEGKRKKRGCSRYRTPWGTRWPPLEESDTSLSRVSVLDSKNKVTSKKGHRKIRYELPSDKR